jgi:hypothetical protein
MSHLDGRTLPQRIAIGAVTEIEWGTEELMLDSGQVVRNQRWAAPLRTFEVSMPIMARDDEDYTDFLQLVADAKGRLHSFDYIDHKDPTDSTVIAVRFATPVRTISITPDLERVEPFTLEEVRMPDS